MAKILVTQRLVEGGDALLLASDHDVAVVEGDGPVPTSRLTSLVGDIDAIVCLLSDRIGIEVMEAAPRLRAIGTVSVGFDNVDVAAAAERGIGVVNTPGVLDASTADLTVLLMLSALRQSSEAEANLRAGRWSGWSLDDHLGRDLSGATVGLVGWGRIARAVARRLAAFDVELLHHSRTDSGEASWVPSLLELAARCDVLSIHVPGSPENRHLVDGSVISAVRPGGVIVNTARGSVLDEHALADALESGHLHGAGLDVYDGEPRVSDRLLSAPRVTLLPHIGSATVSTRLAMCELACSGVLELLEGGSPPNIVSPSS